MTLLEAIISSVNILGPSIRSANYLIIKLMRLLISRKVKGFVIP